jgi:hypothetical protein
VDRWTGAHGLGLEKSMEICFFHISLFSIFTSGICRLGAISLFSSRSYSVAGTAELGRHLVEITCYDIFGNLSTVCNNSTPQFFSTQHVHLISPAKDKTGS